MHVHPSTYIAEMYRIKINDKSTEEKKLSGNWKKVCQESEFYICKSYQLYRQLFFVCALPNILLGTFVYKLHALYFVVNNLWHLWIFVLCMVSQELHKHVFEFLRKKNRKRNM